MWLIWEFTLWLWRGQGKFTEPELPDPFEQP